MHRRHGEHAAALPWSIHPALLPNGFCNQRAVSLERVGFLSDSVSNRVAETRLLGGRREGGRAARVNEGDANDDKRSRNFPCAPLISNGPIPATGVHRRKEQE
jgi:hypothetical protein